MKGRIARCGAALVLGLLWWAAVLRLILVPGAGTAEAAMAAGGWSLSLLPVHCVPKPAVRDSPRTGTWLRRLGGGKSLERKAP
ncbi:hypothetical protein HUT18_27280 [Streptomyces sp. NA04227]|uniref:hypothetical protein n=1 Tax=Streptomyces sp. NA04227 TaxID=2742136 RepID=UPI0015921A78|nr:hypothetical protein [Streptomyces sp. NA04227]QKW04976.1 hypothetical protein HUT18_27280 [Streptomyces sp. NA04227]